MASIPARPGSRWTVQPQSVRVLRRWRHAGQPAVAMPAQLVRSSSTFLNTSLCFGRIRTQHTVSRKKCYNTTSILPNLHPRFGKTRNARLTALPLFARVFCFMQQCSVLLKTWLLRKLCLCLRSTDAASQRPGALFRWGSTAASFSAATTTAIFGRSGTNCKVRATGNCKFCGCVYADGCLQALQANAGPQNVMKGQATHAFALKLICARFDISSPFLIQPRC